MLLASMSTPNPVVYIQFHPVAYMVKLNIEMSMASLITRLARRGNSDEDYPSRSGTTGNHEQPGRSRAVNRSVYETEHWTHGDGIKMTQQSHIVGGGSDESLPDGPAQEGIQRRMEIEVRVETDGKAQDPFKSKWDGKGQRQVEDEIPLTKNTGHPKDGVIVEESRRSNSISS
jgi:hypothetical protein